jgi:hypothetical protein
MILRLQGDFIGLVQVMTVVLTVVMTVVLNSLLYIWTIVIVYL